MTARGTCQLCQDATDVQTLTTACEPGTQRAVTVCEDCLAQRRAKQWDLDQPEGSKLDETLETRTHRHPQGRYAYLLSAGESLHLVRLHHGWIDAHAVPA